MDTFTQNTIYGAALIAFSIVAFIDMITGRARERQPIDPIETWGGYPRRDDS